jgi:hypothetical protein
MVKVFWVSASIFSAPASFNYNQEIMKLSAVALISVSVLAFASICLTGCNKASTAQSATAVSAAAPASTPDAVEKKLQEYSGASATDCGRLDVKVDPDRSKAAADCAMQAGQAKHAFYVAYDMPGMAVGVAGNSAGKLYSVQSQGLGADATLTSGDCPAPLRLAGSGRVTCFAPGDMGAMGGGHTAIPPDMPNPHEFPKSK